MTLVVNNFGRLQTYGNMLLVDGDQGPCPCCECRDGECPKGKKCVDGECIDGCDEQNPCPDGETCVNGECVPVSGNCNECLDANLTVTIQGFDVSEQATFIDDNGDEISIGGFGALTYTRKEAATGYIWNVTIVEWACYASGLIRAHIISWVEDPNTQNSTTWQWQDTVAKPEGPCQYYFPLSDQQEEYCSTPPAGCLDGVDPLGRGTLDIKIFKRE